MPPTNDARANDINDDDYVPAPHAGFHEDERLCKEMVARVASPFPLEIRPSSLCVGSGLFAAAGIDAGREIYHAVPDLAAVDPGNESFCDWCFEDTKLGVSNASSPKAGENVKLCSACKAARFCSKGRELRVRSLKKIAPGEEITICYIDPTFDVAARQEVLKREYFFDCSCARCTSELAEQRALLGGSRDLGPLHQAQRQIRDLLRSAVRASKHPGIYPDLDDLPTVETRLRTITATASPWPDHLEPLPAARLSLALLYLDQGKPIPALRCALKGKFLSSRSRGGPEWVNEMMDVVKVLVVTGCLRPDEAAFEDKTFPELDDIRAVTYGYVYELCREASRAFGGDVNYTKGICGMCTALMAKKAGPRPGTKEFREEFDAAQEKLLTWAGIEVAKGVVLS
ncbi:uncharacterized protein THITE_2144701 [Thermothielavioides terrestris NRRL 8126]|uniref:SET domain-containing protein n=1 Tax=Thermothielavioides terrestris (strain ATCC 38088 / NRRL 8126) TaxID=578455 RepID=G2R0N4_THETT|nr:uncharacterized protein THITE_2144701 [Thermothielavioides terrestris NRRL 8126]AEO67295.1 hypothetical protein THITE_2144701 [Thermothielavioides terrestris NRRL 8126]